MKPQHTLGRATTPDGNELVLYERDGTYSIRVNGLELMSSRAHGSEEALANLVLDDLPKTGASVLVGGLGMGYTLRAVLNKIASDSQVVVAEIFPAVVAWNRAELSHLAHDPLADPRVVVEDADVADVINQNNEIFDAVLLDVDNGPAAFTIARNENLYGSKGLGAIRRCLRPKGALGVWSADPDQPFAKRLARSGFRVRTETVPARQGSKGPKHTIFVASLR